MKRIVFFICVFCNLALAEETYNFVFEEKDSQVKNQDSSITQPAQDTQNQNSQDTKKPVLKSTTEKIENFFRQDRVRLGMGFSQYLPTGQSSGYLSLSFDTSRFWGLNLDINGASQTSLLSLGALVMPVQFSLFGYNAVSLGLGFGSVGLENWYYDLIARYHLNERWMVVFNTRYTLPEYNSNSIVSLSYQF